MIHEEKQNDLPHLIPFHAEIIYYCLIAYAPIDNLDQIEKLFQFFFVTRFDAYQGEILKKNHMLTAPEEPPNDGQEHKHTSHNFNWGEYIRDIMEIRTLLSFNAPIRIWRNSLCFLPLLEAYAYHGRMSQVNDLIEAASLDMGFGLLFDPNWGEFTANTVLKAFKHSESYVDMIRWFVMWYQCEENQRQAPLIANELTYHIVLNNLTNITEMALNEEISISQHDARFFYNLFKDAYLSLQWEELRPRGQMGGEASGPPSFHLPTVEHFQPSTTLNKLMTLLSEYQPQLVFNLFEDCVQSSLNEETIRNKIPSNRLIYQILMNCASKMGDTDRVSVLEELMEKDFELFGREDLNPYREKPLHLAEKMRAHIRSGNTRDAFQLFYNNFQHNSNGFQEDLLEADSTTYAILLQGLAKTNDDTFWIVYQLCEQDVSITWNHVMVLSALRFMYGKNKEGLLYLFDRLFDSPLQTDADVKDRIVTFLESPQYREIFERFTPDFQAVAPEVASSALVVRAFMDDEYVFAMHLLGLLQDHLDMETCTDVYNYILFHHLTSFDFVRFWNLYERYEQYTIDFWKQQMEMNPENEDDPDNSDLYMDDGEVKMLEMPEPGNQRTQELVEQARQWERCMNYSSRLIKKILPGE